MEENKIQEMQVIEHNLQNLLLQKQAFQMDLSETSAALKEVENSSGDVFKIAGQLLIKTDRSEMLNELKEKEKMLKLRMSSIDKQEVSLVEKLNSLREEVLGPKDID